MTDFGNGFGMAAAAPDLVAVCVESRQPFCGEMFHHYSRQGIRFESIYQLVRLIDKLCDNIGYPIRGTNLRSFTKQSLTARVNYRETEQIMSLEEIANKKGPEGTFMVHVRFRQNATWQGQVTWVEKKQTSQFRSALELMNLIDSALSEEEKES